MAEALQELGHEAVRFPFAKIGSPTRQEAETLLQELESRSHYAVFDMACWGAGLSAITLTMTNGNEQLIYDAFDLPCVGMLWDHPHNQNIAGLRAGKLYAAYPDKGHSQQIKLAHPELALTGEAFFPPAIRPGSDYSANNPAVHLAGQRDIDVLYIGNLEPDALERFWNNRINPHWEEIYDARFCDALTDIALEEPERSLHLSVAKAVAVAGQPAPEYRLGMQIRAVEHHLRYSYRRSAVMALAASGVHLTLVGGGWNGTTLPGNVTVLPETSYEVLFRLAARAKICLDTSTYMDGANDRVFSYALNGAVCITNAAGYLRSVFGEGDIRFYSMLDLNGLCEQVKAMLARPEALHDAGQRARSTVLASHTWRNRLEGLLGTLGAARQAPGARH